MIRPGPPPTPTPPPGPHCDCGEPATHQALYRHGDGSHFLGRPSCDAHRTPLGRLRYAHAAEVIDHLQVAAAEVIGHLQVADATDHLQVAEDVGHSETGHGMGGTP